MGITVEEFKKIEHLLPVQHGNVRYDNLAFLNTVLYVAENGCRWRSLPKEHGNWNSIYMRANRWSKAGVLDKVFLALQRERIIAVKVERLSPDSMSVKLHPDAHDAPMGRELLKKWVPPIARCPCSWTGRTRARRLAESLGYVPVVPPKRNRRDPWEYDRDLYRKRNEVERFFRRVSTCYDKLDRMYLMFFTLAFIRDLVA